MNIAVTGKTVYLLGAGASHHSGAPLLRDFMVTARWLYETKPDLEYRDTFTNVFGWVDRLRSSSYYVDFDLDNIEHLFSIAEMMKQLKRETGSEIYSNLKKIIMVTLDICQVIEWHENKYIPDSIYSNFIKMLKKINQQRKQRISTKGKNGFEKDTIITFNYDIALDYCMMVEGIEIDYCLGEPLPGKDNVFKLLKLHGSSNFATCPKCNKKPYQIISMRKEDFVSLGQSNGDPIASEMVSKIMKKEKCSECGETGLEPLIIPPTWSKDVEDHPLSTIWSSAVDEIQKAQQIVIVGYSLPQTDTFLQYLLTLALEKNKNMNRVVVVNTDCSDEFKARYKKVFSRSLNDRGRLIFIDESWKDRIINRPGAPPRSKSEIIMDFKTYIYNLMADISKNIN